MEEIRTLFTVDNTRLQQLCEDMRAEMRLGLCQDAAQSSLKMILTYVRHLPEGNEKGSFLAIDLGGSNFRVLRLTLDGTEKGDIQKNTYKLTEEHMTSDASVLFGFIADCVKSFAPETVGAAQPVPLGFTFSFPVRQTSINSGFLISWTKGFSAKGCEGQDVVALLQKCLAERNINVSVTAIVNDTVGTLMARASSSHKCYIGVIFGTGTNACYFEEAKNIHKGGHEHEELGMVINMEWGGFGDTKTCLEGRSMLPWTPWDQRVDRTSIHPNIQLFEKMISGKYQGEVVRHLALDLAERGLLFGGKVSEELRNTDAFGTKHLSEVEEDTSEKLDGTRAILQDVLKVAASHEDCACFRELCQIVSTRAARLSAAACAAVTLQLGPRAAEPTVIAVDGTVFQRHPTFRHILEATLEELRENRFGPVSFAPAEDGSGRGAALVVAAACSSQ